MKVALVHDYLTQYGGAERTLEAITRIWPEAPIHTSIWEKKKLSGMGFELQQNEVKSSFMQRLPFKERFANTYFLPLYPLAFENFQLDGFDVVISVNSYASKAIITKPETLHISYCCTPPRHLWNFDDYIAHHKHVKQRHKVLLKPMISYLRLWDQVASTRVDTYIAISTEVKKRIEQVYKREAVVIFPPVNTKKYARKTDFVPEEKEYFLIVSRLGGHKRVDLAIKAFNKMPDKKLIIIGSGPMKQKYQEMAHDNIIFKGRLTDEEVVGYYQNCQAFLYPQEEDFGITAVEAQAAGKPVIGYKKGGLLDTVIEGKTGIFFKKQTEKELINAVQSFKVEAFRKEDCQFQAEKFSQEVFSKALIEFVEKAWVQYSSEKR